MKIGNTGFSYRYVDGVPKFSYNVEDTHDYFLRRHAFIFSVPRQGS